MPLFEVFLKCHQQLFSARQQRANNIYQYSLFIILPFLAYLFCSTFPFQILKYFCLYKAFPIYPKMEEGSSVNCTISWFSTNWHLTKDILILKLVIGNISVQIVLMTLILDLHRNQRMYIKLHSPSYEPYSDCDHLIPRDHPFSTVSEMIPCDHLIIQTHFATFDLVGREQLCSN